MVDVRRHTAVPHSLGGILLEVPLIKLLYTWHVDCAWQGNLHVNQIRKRELAATVYHNLQVFLEETDVHTLEQLLIRHWYS